MIMMDGVLEKRWEDELKKDVPKPECMVVSIFFFPLINCIVK